MKLRTKLKNLVGRRARVARLEEEMRHHVDLLTEENIARGMDRVEARRRAHLAFGNLLAMREESQDALGWPSLESWWQDARQSVRALMRRPGFSIALIAVLALGIGVTTAVFTLVRGVLLDPLRVPDPQELRLVVEPRGEPFLLSAPTLRRLEAEPSLSGRVMGYSGTSRVALRVGDAPAEPASIQFVSGGFFSALRVLPVKGRALTPSDDTPEASRAVAVASHAFWRRKFGDAPVDDRHSVRLNGLDVAIVGVMPESFTGVALGHTPDLWLPLGLHAPLHVAPSAWTVTDGPVTLEQWAKLDNIQWLSVMARASRDEAEANSVLMTAWRPQLDAILAIITDPTMRKLFQERTPRWVESPQGYSDTRLDFRRVGLTLTLLVVAVVLVTAANSATLLLLRMLGRGRELGVRLALGAGRWRLARSALMEGLLLSLTGAAGGVLIGVWLAPVLAEWLVPGIASDLPTLDWKMLSVLASLAVLLGLAMGCGPAWLTSRLSPQTILQQRLLGVGGTLRLGRALIIAQLALSVMLISIAGALAMDLRRVLAEHPGYARESVIQAFFDLGAAGIPVERQNAVLERLRAAARELPQVRAVGFAASGVLSGSRSRSGLYFRGDDVRRPDDNVQHESIEAGYHEAMGMPILRGRSISEHDTAQSTKVAVISERLAREVFGNADPIGRRFGFGESPDDDDREIVGIVADARVNGVREEPPAIFYTALDQWLARPGCLVVRVAGDARGVLPTLKAKISAAEPNVMFTRWSTLEERAQRWVRNDVATVRLTAGFGLLATLLAVIGVLGALGYLVASRSREIAVRLAIGAEPGRVGRDILRDAGILGALGAVVGVGLATLLPRVLGSWMMTGLQADAMAIAVAAIAGLVAALIGGLLPARRATKVDPITLLRAE